MSFGVGDPGAQARALENQSPEKQLALLSDWASRGELDPQVAEQVQNLRATRTLGRETWKRRLSQVVEALRLRAEGSASQSKTDDVALARQIKSSPLYRDPGLREQTNWLSGAAARLNNLHPDLSCKEPDVKPVNGPELGAWLIYVMWTVLALAVTGFLVFAYKRFSWSKGLERKAKALLDEDEPERTLDEWLDLANRLEREGRHREAVRCLYLACLLKLDEARVARFERSETNWEHLARIEASPKKPADLDFRSPTKAFDEIWYGMRVNGAEDVARFRTWYTQVTEAVRARAA